MFRNLKLPAALVALAIWGACESPPTGPVQEGGDFTPDLNLANPDFSLIQNGEGGVPFVCTGQAILMQENPARLYEVDQSAPGAFTISPLALSNPNNWEINNVGFDASRNILWGWRRCGTGSPQNCAVANQQVVTIDAAGTITPQGRGDLPTPINGTATLEDDYRFFAGDVEPDGSKFYLNWNGGGGIYTVALDGLTKVYAGSRADGYPQITENGTSCTPAPGNPCGRVSDWAALNGYLFGGNDGGPSVVPSATDLVAILDPATGQRTDVAVDLNSFSLPTTDRGFGAVWFSPSLKLFLLHNSGDIYEIDLQPGANFATNPTDVSPKIVSVQTSDPLLNSTFNDGAACVTPEPKIGLVKTADPTSLPAGGGLVTYTYTITNLSDEGITLTSLVDNVLGDLGDDLDLECSPDPIGQTLQPNGGVGDTFECSVSTTITETTVNVAEACGRDAFNIEFCDEDDALVTVEAANPSVLIEKSTNGEDADVLTGPEILVGETVTWTYVVTNNGNVPLTDVTVTDDQLADDAAEISCADGVGTNNVIQSLDPGVENQVTCTATGTAAAGQYANVGTASSQYDGQAVEDTDPSHYLGVESFVAIYKTTNEAPADPSQDIQFALYDADGNELEIVSTLNNGAELEFMTSLFPGDSYTICEYPVPAAYTFEITVDGGIVLTYAGPPGEQNPTGEIQCFDFMAAANGVTLTYNVENSFPGGAPRTPGYWKNWSTCSGGNQAATAARLGGTAEGIYLLDELLPQTVGELTITNCEDGVSVLDTRNINNGRKMGGDAGYILARSYLAANLNLDAGACPAAGSTFDLSAYGRGAELTFQQVLNAAQQVLVDNNYDGTGRSIGNRAADRDLALALYEIIDDYNNGEICTGLESH